MKRFQKVFLLTIMIFGILLLAGCNKLNLSFFNASEEDKNPKTTQASEDPQVKENKASGEPGSDKGVTPTPSLKQPTANIELPVYTVNAETEEIEPVTALVPAGSELTPKLIVETVVESMADQSIIVGIKDVTTRKDTVIVNFTKDNPPSKNTGSGYEEAILNAIAQSLIDNLEDYSKVIYRIDDGPYQSGIFEYGIDDVYMGDN